MVVRVEENVERPLLHFAERRPAVPVEMVQDESRHHVRVVYDGLSALAEMEKELPQVMVIDWMMPGLSGEEVLRKVKAAHPGLPVIVLTGHQAVDDNGQDPVAGAFMCLTKPVAFATLLDAITAAALSSGEVRS